MYKKRFSNHHFIEAGYSGRHITFIILEILNLISPVLNWLKMMMNNVNGTHCGQKTKC